MIIEVSVVESQVEGQDDLTRHIHQGSSGRGEYLDVTWSRMIAVRWNVWGR